MVTVDTVLEAEVPLASALADLRGRMAGPDAPRLGESNRLWKSFSLSDLQLMQVPFRNDLGLTTHLKVLQHRW